METVNFQEKDEEFEQQQKVAQAILKKLQDKKLAQKKT